MSVLAHSKTTKENQSEQNQSTVTAINANARIDYILRFSKHVVLVLDEHEQGYGDICGQFLSSLPDNHNAAYLSASSQFNDIQVRCRIAEQLFPGSLFDPEQPLASSLVNLMGKEKLPISIAIEHAQNLSLQLIHELCQLADIAKKTKREINIVLTGAVGAGRVIAKNQPLFSQKISMISAQTGQLISTRSEMFKETSKAFSFGGYKKFILLFLLLICLSIAAIWALYQRDNFAFSGLNDVFSGLQNPVETMNPSSEQFVMPNITERQSVVQDTNSPSDTKIDSPLSLQPNGKEASALDILSAISAEHSVLPEESVEVIEYAETQDVFHALSQEAQSSQEVNGNDSILEHSGLESEMGTEEYIAPKPKLDDNYYTDLDLGFVIQYVAIGYKNESDAVAIVEKFIQPYEDYRFKFYRRHMNGQNMVVITSEFYVERNDAKEELANLPEELSAHGPWIKSAQAIKDDIEAFKSSQ